MLIGILSVRAEAYGPAARSDVSDVSIPYTPPPNVWGTVRIKS
jgi:hypothetical protein